MSLDPTAMFRALPAPRNRREARKWVRLHWAAFMAGADVPDLKGVQQSAADLIADVFSDEGRRLAARFVGRSTPEADDAR